MLWSRRPVASAEEQAASDGGAVGQRWWRSGQLADTRDAGDTIWISREGQHVVMWADHLTRQPRQGRQPALALRKWDSTVYCILTVILRLPRILTVILFGSLTIEKNRRWMRKGRESVQHKEKMRDGQMQLPRSPKVPSRN
ncbi:uncharacterized protein LOC107304231 isoform X1 [Oryza brachyantha]|uniref:uncharacterized protein LOC107304231 isoform X1 n=1 Tax=Oryza brachyantha TaxID=4533 RepID=UPI001AD96CAD|nr:uncharacterized protein LOC107304231 isoform X1 [Oryza brachyantha]